MERARQCALVADQLKAMQSEYHKRRDDYDFKNDHPLDAQMDECELHWKDWVCLKRGGSDGGVSYANEWNESGNELQRKLSLEHEELNNLEQQIESLTQTDCSHRDAEMNSSSPNAEHAGGKVVTKFSWKNLKDGHLYTTQLSGEKLHLEPTENLPSTTADIVSCDFSRSVSIGISWIGTCAERNRIDRSVSRSAEYITLFSDSRIEGTTFVLVPVE